MIQRALPRGGLREDLKRKDSCCSIQRRSNMKEGDGAEALASWQHWRREAWFSSEFFGSRNAAGLILPLGRPMMQIAPSNGRCLPIQRPSICCRYQCQRPAMRQKNLSKCPRDLEQTGAYQSPQNRTHGKHIGQQCRRRDSKLDKLKALGSA